MEVSQQSQNNQAAKQSQRIVKEENRINSCCHLSSDTFSLAISSTFNIPIFGVRTVIPTMPCSLHIFESHHHLLVRRCTETGSGQFGMCAYDVDQPHEFAQFGTMLQIKKIEAMADGSCLLETKGLKRFRVLSRGVLDGYCTASVEWIVDESLTSLSIEEQSVVVELHDRVRSDAVAWIQSQSKSTLGRHIDNVYGSIPDVESDWIALPDGPNWLWWLTAVIPFDSDDQVRILSMTRLANRLEMMRHSLFNAQWMFASAMPNLFPT